jgi:Cytochrome c554 and c-prime
LGGLSKKIFQIQTISVLNNQERLLLDSGNLLFKHLDVAAGPNQQRLTAKAIMQIYQNIGYDAVGIGPFDMAGGLDFLQTDGAEDFPWISANILDENKQPLFSQWISKEIQGVHVIITALSAPPQQVFPTITIAPWESILPELLSQLTKENTDPFIILLSSLSREENRLIAEQYPAINILLGANQHQKNASPQLINNTIVTQTKKQGQYQGLLKINFGKQRTWGQDREKQVADLQNRLGSLNWQLKRLKKKSAKSTSEEKYSSTIARLQQDQEKIKAKLTSLQKTITQEQSSGTLSDQYQSRFIALKKNLPNDVNTDKILLDLNQKVRQLHKRPLKLHTGDIKESFLPDHDLIGFRVCESCHPTQTKFWQTTQHANAYMTLVKKEKNLDLECLPCHVTRNLFTNEQNIPKERLLSFPRKLQAVGCESCHGSGKKHSINPEQFKMVRQPEKDICLTCHTPEHDDDFDYETKLVLISCPPE